MTEATTRRYNDLSLPEKVLTQVSTQKETLRLHATAMDN